MIRHIYIHDGARDEEYKGFTISKTVGGWYTVSYVSAGGKRMSFGEKFRTPEEAKQYVRKETQFDRARDVAPEKSDQIKARYKSLKAYDTKQLKEIVGRSYRVVDLRGVGKEQLIGMILDAEFGGKAVAAAFSTDASNGFEMRTTEGVVVRQMPAGTGHDEAERVAKALAKTRYEPIVLFYKGSKQATYRP